MTRWECCIVRWADDAQIGGFEQGRKLFHAAVVVEIPTDDCPFSPLNNCCSFGKLFLAHRSMERKVPDEQRKILSDGDIVEKFFRAVLKFACTAGESVDAEDRITIVSEERQAPEHASFTVLRIDVLAAVCAEVFQKCGIVVRLENTADIRLDVLYECAESFVDRLDDAAWGMEIAPGLCQVAMQRPVETCLIAEIEEQDAVCLHLYII